MHKTRNAILVAMTAILASFSGASLADNSYTAHDRALGKNKAPSNYNMTNSSGEYEVYRGVWSKGEISDASDYEEVYSGVWRKKAQDNTPTLANIDANEKRYRIERERKENGGLTDKEIQKVYEDAEKTSKKIKKAAIAEGDSGQVKSTNSSYKSNISTSTSSKNAVGNNEYRSSNVISSGGGVTIMKGEQSAKTRIPALESLIN